MCLNGGACHHVDGSCSCTAGFIGVHCEQSKWMVCYFYASALKLFLNIPQLVHKANLVKTANSFVYAEIWAPVTMSVVIVLVLLDGLGQPVSKVCPFGDVQLSGYCKCSLWSESVCFRGTVTMKIYWL